MSLKETYHSLLSCLFTTITVCLLTAINTSFLFSFTGSLFHTLQLLTIKKFGWWMYEGSDVSELAERKFSTLLLPPPLLLHIESKLPKSKLHVSHAIKQNDHRWGLAEPGNA